jgi:hypothetical protein
MAVLHILRHRATGDDRRGMPPTTTPRRRALSAAKAGRDPTGGARLEIRQKHVLSPFCFPGRERSHPASAAPSQSRGTGGPACRAMEGRHPHRSDARAHGEAGVPVSARARVSGGQLEAQLPPQLLEAEMRRNSPRGSRTRAPLRQQAVGDRVGGRGACRSGRQPTVALRDRGQHA